MKQNVKTNNDTSREVMLTESKTMREGYVKNEEYYDVLDKIKAIPYMTEDMIVSSEQIANYYEVSTEAIKTIIKRSLSPVSIFISRKIIFSIFLRMPEFLRFVHRSFLFPVVFNSVMNNCNS